jgi:GMP synthase-like glutamine amidotransferase
MRIHCLQHVPFEGPANLLAWSVSRGHKLQVQQLWERRGFPLLANFDALFVLGGPMSVSDDRKHLWLKDEKRFIERAIREEMPVLGVCLGAQLIADVLGAPVRKNRCKEIGWFPVEATREAHESESFGTLPRRFVALHWHGETFAIPTGARHLASSEACRNQAFEYERALGLQFHLESTAESVATLIENCPEDVRHGQYRQTPEQMLGAAESFQEIQVMLFELLDHFCGSRR